MRLDVYLSKHGRAKSRSRAAELIAGGHVTVGGKVITKPAYDVEEGDDVSVGGDTCAFVSRGGIKLDGALDRFGIDVKDMICADIGASTGGFTDCLLQRGARHVYAIDSGHDQLDVSLVNDSRVTNIEGFNARYLAEDTLPEKCDIAVSDRPFISQRLVIPAIRNIVRDGALYVSLIKPQFECGRAAIGKGGIVRDKKQHELAVTEVLMCARACGFSPKHVMKSPIQGGDGNTEFLFAAVLGGEDKITEKDISEAVYG